MKAKIICYPPLGQPTTIPAGRAFKFIVVLEVVGDSSANKEWQVALWHDYDPYSRGWTEQEFEEVSRDHQILNYSSASSLNVQRKVFTTDLRGRPHDRTEGHFTIKYRASNSSEWVWANEQFLCGDGTLLFQPTFCSAGQHQDLDWWISGLSEDVKQQALNAETPNTHLWSLTTSVDAARGSSSGYSKHRLGLPKSFIRWFALVRLWSPWLAPRHGKDKFSPDKDAVLAAFLRSDGHHVVILAVSGIGDVLTLLTHDDSGNVIISGRNDAETEGTSHVLVAVAESFEIANAAVMYQARRMIMSLTPTEHEAEVTAFYKDHVQPEWLEELADGLSYCTWNSLGQRLTEDKILNALDSLKNSGIEVSGLIIDDLWQSVDGKDTDEQYGRGMTRFEANEHFPSGLWHTVHEIRRRHPNINHVSVWHAILGYWGGISPDGQLAKDFKTVRVSGPDWLCIDPDDASRWYQSFYEFLVECGVDSVKTDAQFMLDDLHSAEDRRRMIREYQDVWSIAMLRNFSGRAISCMSQTPQMLFHSQLPTNKPKVIVRNSDDFFPDVLDSHPWHLFCNAHNALFTQHLNVLPDWDMFQTGHPNGWAHAHAAARCLSGGPIYITDTPGQHDVNLIAQMTAKTPRGNTVILRPPVIGKTSKVYTGYDELRSLRIETYSGAARTGSSMLGLFNTTKAILNEIVTLNDLPGTEEGEYVIRSHNGKDISKPTTRASAAVVITVGLDPKVCEVYSATPVRRARLNSGEIAVSTLGLLGKFSGAAAIVGIDIYTEKNGHLRVYSSYKALGIVGFYISDLASRSLEMDFMAQMFGKGVPLEAVRKSLDYENVLEIDTEKAWKLSDQKQNWSNEVHLELFIFR